MLISRCHRGTVRDVGRLTVSEPMTMSASLSSSNGCRATSMALCVAVSAAYAAALGKLLLG
eukprot:scaffold648976_cov50-Prasinocladus_malaysianus.AAC.1